jgi:tetratricopeptide (TPR) repeat protein
MGLPSPLVCAATAAACGFTVAWLFIGARGASSSGVEGETAVRPIAAAAATAEADASAFRAEGNKHVTAGSHDAALAAYQRCIDTARPHLSGAFASAGARRQWRLAVANVVLVLNTQGRNSHADVAAREYLMDVGRADITTAAAASPVPVAQPQVEEELELTVKVLYRRAQALKAMGQADQALQWLRVASTLSKNGNAQVEQLLKELVAKAPRK